MVYFNKPISYKDWHLPFIMDSLTLRQAVDYMKVVGEEEIRIPLMVQMVENPRFKPPGVSLFRGSVTLKQHDFIHLLLGRGLLPRDEAFVIGFTMGTTGKISALEQKLFGWISNRFYPDAYKLGDEDIAVFNDGVKLGSISGCQPLDEIDFESMMNDSLRDVRQKVGLEASLLMAYYEIEQKRYPDSVESQRLL